MDFVIPLPYLMNNHTKVIRVSLSIERIELEENIPILTLSISLKVIAYSNSTMNALTLNTIPMGTSVNRMHPNNERNHRLP